MNAAITSLLVVAVFATLCSSISISINIGEDGGSSRSFKDSSRSSVDADVGANVNLPGVIGGIKDTVGGVVDTVNKTLDTVDKNVNVGVGVGVGDGQS